MRDDITKKYSNGEITVVWKPGLCGHSANCWKGLGSVFKPSERPWIQMDGASSAEIMAQVEKCPSGALSYFRNDAGSKPESISSAPTIEVTRDGPLVITGEIVITLQDGTEETRKKASLCRCGQSGKKPFCDGTHTKVGFKG